MGSPSALLGGGDVVWSNAFQSSTPSNWARWDLTLETTGQYEIEVSLDPAHAQVAFTEYQIDIADNAAVLDVNQGAGKGWTSIGTFAFGIGAKRHFHSRQHRERPWQPELHRD